MLLLLLALLQELVWAREARQACSTPGGSGNDGVTVMVAGMIIGMGMIVAIVMFVT